MKLKNKNLIAIALCSLLCLGSCSKREGDYDPEFKKMNFALDYKQQEVETKSQSMGWGIKGLILDGEKELDFFTGEANNAKEMELDSIALKLEYEIEYLNPETGVVSYLKPNKISSAYFDILKPTERNLKIKLTENLTGKDRVIKIHVGDGNYFGYIDIKQSAKPK